MKIAHYLLKIAHYFDFSSLYDKYRLMYLDE